MTTHLSGDSPNGMRGRPRPTTSRCLSTHVCTKAHAWPFSRAVVIVGAICKQTERVVLS
jgi:hypothetical protein